MSVRGIRGATTVSKNTKENIIDSTFNLLSEMITLNKVEIHDIASIFFTTTKDLNAEFPAVAARKKLSMNEVPLLNMHEIDNPEGLQKCIRILIHWNTIKIQTQIKHVYLNGATSLRPDL
tara:strand:+ start:452 stop:811 length:360 start_codon:yes stop_codon:yes gene_type:complete